MKHSRSILLLVGFLPSKLCGAQYLLELDAFRGADPLWSLRTTISVGGTGVYGSSAFSDYRINILGNRDWLILDRELVSFSQPFTRLVVGRNYFDFYLALDDPATVDDVDYWIDGGFLGWPGNSQFQLVNEDGTLNSVDSTKNQHIYEAGYNTTKGAFGGARAGLFRLTAIPEPSSSLMVLGFLCSLSLRRNRKEPNETQHHKSGRAGGSEA